MAMCFLYITQQYIKYFFHIFLLESKYDDTRNDLFHKKTNRNQFYDPNNVKFNVRRKFMASRAKSKLLTQKKLVQFYN